MKFLGFEFRREQKGAQFEDVLARLRAVMRGAVGDITPDNCMRSPTVQAIVQSISRRIAVSPVHVYRKGSSDGRETKEKLPNHPVARLLNQPNQWQTRTEYWFDAASCFVRWGRYHAFKSRGSTGPIRELIPLHPSGTSLVQDSSTYAVRFRVNTDAGFREYSRDKVHYVRGPARDFLTGDSPVKDVAMAISLEIAAEEYGSSFFDNGALPLMIFKYIGGAFKTEEQERKFVDDFQNALGGRNRHRALLLPKGIEAGNPVSIENDKAQMIEARKHQRTVIAGAFGVPPHLTGDVVPFDNIEQLGNDFTRNVVQPIATAFEAAMERDLLTDEDRAQGIAIRFNLDSTLRADFKSRQEGLRIQRDAGVISPNEWREIEGKNPIPKDKGGDDYLRPGNMLVAGEKPPEKDNGTQEPAPANQAA